MIAIIDYKMGNLRSVENALHRLGAAYVVTDDAQTIRCADRVLLPGVGNCAEAMYNLRESGLIPIIKQLRQPVLGICVGLQVMCRDSEEGAEPGMLTQCMNIFDSHVRRFPESDSLKVPHMGWNTIGNLEKNCLMGCIVAILCITCILITQRFVQTRLLLPNMGYYLVLP